MMTFFDEEGDDMGTTPTPEVPASDDTASEGGDNSGTEGDSAAV